LPEEEKFLSFDRLWEIYEDETPMPGTKAFTITIVLILH